MSLSDQLQRVIYRLKAEGADKVKKDFEGIEDAAEGVAREAINVEKAVATIGIQAEETKTRLQRMVDSAGGGFTSIRNNVGQVAGGFQSAMKGFNDLAGKLGPWNQALELGGKAVKFIDESFDALAAKEPGRRKEIEETRKAFKGLGDGVKEATAELALFVADGWAPVEEALKRAQRITKEVRDFYKLDDRLAAKGLGVLFGGGITESIGEALDNQWGVGVDEMLEKVGEAKKKFDDELKKTASDLKKSTSDARRAWEDEMRDWAAERADIIRPTYEAEHAPAHRWMKSDEPENAPGRASRTVQGSMPSVLYQADDFESIINSTGAKAESAFAKMNEKAYGAFVDSQSKSKLEALFGPVEEIDLYTQSLTALGGVFSAFSEAVGAGYAAIVTGQGSVVSAIKNAASAALMAQGKQSVVAALRETALGFGALALGSPTAAAHFKSAAIHGAVAAAAGAAAYALGGGGAGASTPASTGGSSAGSSGGSGSLADKIVGGGQGGGKETIIVAYMDPFANQPEHIRRQQAREMVANVVGKGAVEDS